MFVLRIFLALLLLFPAPVGAAVVATFHSSDSRTQGGSIRFPHAFVVLSGTRDSDGLPIDTSIGFTARRVSPAILFGAVEGMVVTSSKADIERSRRHFAVRLDDRQLAALFAVTERYKALGKKGYRLNARNCVDFVADLGRALGLAVRADRILSKKPSAFLDDMRLRNPGRLLTF